LGIGIAFRKKALQEVGGFNNDLQVFEWLELSLRSNGFKGVKTPEMTVLHLEPENRFNLGGYLRRKIEYGFWYHSLYYLHPKKLSVFAFPVKLLFLVGMITGAILFHSYLFLVALSGVYLYWIFTHYQLLRKNNVVKYAMSNFARAHEKFVALVLAMFVLSAGEIAGDVGKLWGMARSPVKKSASSA
jgi:hypothetical protein